MKRFDKYKKIMILAISIAIFFEFQFAGNNIVLADSQENHDVSELVKIDPVSVYLVEGSSKILVIDEGKKVENAPEIKVGDLTEYHYEFHIDSESLKKISEGDYFYINLPDSQYVKTVEGVFPIKNPDGDLYGNYTIENGRIKVVLTKIGTQEAKEDGWINVDGTAIKDGEDILLDSNGNTTMTIKPGNGGSGGNGGNDAGKNEILDKEVKFTKNGKQYLGKNILNWHLNVNYDGLRQMILGAEVAEKSNVILEDTLPENVSADLNSVYITVPLYVPTPDNKMSGYAIGYPRVHPEIVIPDENESYEEFYKRIRTRNKLSVGIYNKNGKNSILFGFGKLPNNGLTYSNIMGNESEFHKIIDDHVKSGDITEQQSKRMKEVYGVKGSSQGSVLGYDVSFDTIVSGESGNYENKAQLHWSTDDHDYSKYSIAFNKTDSGIIGNEEVSFKVKKKWIGNENRPNHIDIILYSNGNKKERISINESDGWQYTFSNLPKYDSRKKKIKYTISEEKVDGYETRIKEVGKNHWEITNISKEILSIPVKKSWIGKQGKVIKLELLKDNQATNKIIRLTKDSGWKGEFKNLPKYDQNDGHIIDYKIKEIGENKNYIRIEDELYKVTYSGNKESVLTVNNEHIPPVIPMEPPKYDNPPKHKHKKTEKTNMVTPNTGDSSFLIDEVSLLIISVVLLIVIGFLRRKYLEK